MASAIFNPNELLLDRVRFVEEFNPSTSEIMGRYTQIEDPTLETSSDATDVVDAIGTPIHTFYRNQQGTFGFSNSLHSVDLFASQFGSEKVLATEDSKIKVPVSETITIGKGGKVILKYTPVGVAGAEVKYVKVINDNASFGETYEVSASEGDGKFTIDAGTKTITLPSNVTGKVFVSYYKESQRAVKITKDTDGMPPVRELHIHVIFRDPCDANLKYSGVIVCPRAQIDPSSVSINLTSDGKHAASYKLQRPYCDSETKLFDIIIDGE